MVQLLLGFVVFVSGAVLMSLEIAGSRILAPHFGSSIFVWGSLISVVMASSRCRNEASEARWRAGIGGAFGAR